MVLTCKSAVCAAAPLHWQRVAADTLAAESTGVSVSPWSLPDQHRSAETDGCLFSSTGDSGKHGEALFPSRIYLKHSWLQHTILGNVFPVFHLSLVSFFSFLLSLSFNVRSTPLRLILVSLKNTSTYLILRSMPVAL